MTFGLAATRLAVWPSARAARGCAAAASTPTSSMTASVLKSWPPSRRLDTAPSHTCPGELVTVNPIYRFRGDVIVSSRFVCSSSLAISAMWDQEGGFRCDQHGVVTKEWRWLTGLTQMEKIVVQVRPRLHLETCVFKNRLVSRRCVRRSL